MGCGVEKAQTQGKIDNLIYDLKWSLIATGLALTMGLMEEEDNQQPVEAAPEAAPAEEAPAEEAPAEEAPAEEGGE